MIYQTSFKSRRPHPIALGLRKTFQPVTEMTPPLEAALKRLIVLDFDPRLADANDDTLPLGGPLAGWEPVHQAARRMPELAR